MTKISIALLGVFALTVVARGPASAQVGPNLCTSKKLKAAGKKAFKKANCWSKAVKKGANIDFGCLCGEDAKLSDAFTKAEGLGTCIGGTGDAGSIGGKVDAFVTDLVDELTS